MLTWYVDLVITSCIINVNMGLYLHETLEHDAVLFCLHCALEKCTGILRLFESEYAWSLCMYIIWA